MASSISHQQITPKIQTIDSFKMGYLVFSKYRLECEYWERLWIFVVEMYTHIPLVSVNSLMCSMISCEFMSLSDKVLYTC